MFSSCSLLEDRRAGLNYSDAPASLCHPKTHATASPEVTAGRGFLEIVIGNCDMSDLLAPARVCSVPHRRPVLSTIKRNTLLVSRIDENVGHRWRSFCVSNKEKRRPQERTAPSQ
jgi:hypothetical protein